MEISRTQEKRRISIIQSILETQESIAWKTQYGECHLFTNVYGQYELNVSNIRRYREESEEKQQGKVTVYIIDTSGEPKEPVVVEVNDEDMTISNDKGVIIDIDTVLETLIETEREQPEKTGDAVKNIDAIRNQYKLQATEVITRVYDLSDESELYSHKLASKLLPGVESIRLTSALYDIKEKAIQHLISTGQLPEEIFNDSEIVDIASKNWRDAPDYKTKLQFSEFLEGKIKYRAEDISKIATANGIAAVDKNRYLREFRQHFMEKIIEEVPPADPRDKAILKEHAAALEPALWHKIMLSGGKDEKVTTVSPKKMECTYRFYNGEIIARGGLGEIANVFYLIEGSQYLREGAKKTPKLLQLGNTEGATNAEHEKSALVYFEFEKYMAEKFRQIREANPNHPGIWHIMEPLAIGENFILLPKINSPVYSHKKPATLKELCNNKAHHAEFIKNLGDVAMAYDLLSQNGIIPLDGKPENVLCGAEGAVLIDLAGFVDIHDKSVGVTYLLDKNNEPTLPILYKKTSDNLHGYATTPGYSDPNLSVQEYKNAVPCDLSAKLSLAMMIANLLIKKGYIDEDFIEDFGNTPQGAKETFPLPGLVGGTIPDGIQKLYELFTKLFQARKHITPDDPKHITLRKAAEELRNLRIIT